LLTLLIIFVAVVFLLIIGSNKAFFMSMLYKLPFLTAPPQKKGYKYKQFSQNPDQTEEDFNKFSFDEQSDDAAELIRDEELIADHNEKDDYQESPGDISLQEQKNQG